MRGSGSTNPVNIHYYRSTNNIITPFDTLLGTDPVASLPSGDSRTESFVTIVPSSAGTYYYGVCIERGDCTSGFRVVVSPPPQSPTLNLRSFRVSDSTPFREQNITLSVMARNIGGGTTEATNIRYYGTASLPLTRFSAFLGTDRVASLSSGLSEAESFVTTAPSFLGTYYYGACIEGGIEGVDCTQGLEVVVSPLPPKLELSNFGVSISKPLAGNNITLSVTARNTGEGITDATTISYYRSTDAIISTSDTFLGMDQVFSLSSHDSRTESFVTDTPSSLGTYYYGVCIEGGDCTSGLEVVVSPVPPTLELSNFRVSDNTSLIGQNITLSVSVTVNNTGEGTTGATNISYYHSTNRFRIVSSGILLGTVPVAPLSLGGNRTESFVTTAPSSPGTYYYGVCIEGGRCAPVIMVFVSSRNDTPSDQPSRLELSISVNDSTPFTGQNITLSVTARNTGGGTTDVTTINYYHSTDNFISSSDTLLGADRIVSLSSGRSSSESITTTAPSSPGTYYYGACVTGGTCTSGEMVVVSVPSPRLELSISVNDSTPFTGQNITLSVTARNTGGGTTDVTTINYYHSTDNFISSSDTLLGADRIVSLSSGRSSSESITTTAPSSPGTYYYGACVTGGTCTSGEMVVVSVPSPRLELSISVNDSTPFTGQNITLSVTARNTGGETTDATTIRYYRSTNSVISPSDTSLGTDTVVSLSAGDSSPNSLVTTVPSSAGTYYYGACINGGDCTSGVSVVVSVPPRLGLNSLGISNAAPTEGQDITLFARVENTEGGVTPETIVRYYFSTDDVISTNDILLGISRVAPLSVGLTRVVSVSVLAPSSEGTYYYGVCIEGGVCSSARIKVVVSGPRLSLRLVSISDVTPFTGRNITLFVKVVNTYGRVTPETIVRYYFSTNAIISPADTEAGTARVAPLSAGLSRTVSVMAMAPSSAGTYYYGVCIEGGTCSSGHGPIEVFVSVP